MHVGIQTADRMRTWLSERKGKGDSRWEVCVKHLSVGRRNVRILASPARLGALRNKKKK